MLYVIEGMALIELTGRIAGRKKWNKGLFCCCIWKTHTWGTTRKTNKL